MRYQALVHRFPYGTVEMSNGLTLAGGVNFGGQVGSSPIDFSKHIALYGASYGISITGSRLNYVADPAAIHAFMHGSVSTMTLASSGLTLNGALSASGGVKLGELSPTIKCKVVEGTLSATAGATTNIAHGLASADVIIGVTAAVQFSTSPSKWVAPNTFFSDSQFAFLWDGTNLSVSVHATASAVVLGKKVRFTILYTA